MRQYLFMALLLTLLFGCSTVTQSRNNGVTTTGFVIDTRTEAEWAEGHLEGAVLIPHDKIEEKIAAAVPGKEAKIDLYCRSGRRSGLALESLKKLGYTNITNLGPMDSAAKTLHRPIVK